MMDDKDKCLNAKNKKFFYLITRENVTKNHDESLSFDYLIYIYIYIYIYISYFEHSGDISCSLLINPSHTEESWEGRNMCLWIYTLWIYSLSTLENPGENRIFFVSSPHYKHFSKAQHLVLWGFWWHQLFSTR